MVKLREALLVFQALMLVISPQQPNQEDHHSSTSLNPLRTSAGIQLAAFNKTVEHLEAPASEEASLTISRDLTAAQTKLPSTKAILCLSGTKQRKTKITTVIILISRTGLEDTTNSLKNRRCWLLRAPSRTNMPKPWCQAPWTILIIGTSWQMTTWETPLTSWPESTQWMACLNLTGMSEWQTLCLFPHPITEDRTSMTRWGTPTRIQMDLTISSTREASTTRSHPRLLASSRSSYQVPRTWAAAKQALKMSG